MARWRLLPRLRGTTLTAMVAVGCGCATATATALLEGRAQVRPPAAAAAATAAAEPGPAAAGAQEEAGQEEEPPACPLPSPGMRLRRHYSTHRSGEGDWATEWTPEGGGNTPVLRSRATAIRGREAREEAHDEGPSVGGQPRIRRRPSGAPWRTITRGEEAGKGEGRGEVLMAEQVMKRVQAWETQPPGPCDKYNALTTRFLGWETRRRECNAMPGCVFVGRSVTGFCVGEQEWEDAEEETTEDEEEDDRYDFPSSSDPEGAMVETELLASLVTVIREEGIEQPVRLLITVRAFVHMWLQESGSAS